MSFFSEEPCKLEEDDREESTENREEGIRWNKQ